MVSRFAWFDWRLDVQDDGAIYLHQFKPSYPVLQVGRVTPEGIVATEPDCRKWGSR